MKLPCNRESTTIIIIIYMTVDPFILDCPNAIDIFILKEDGEEVRFLFISISILFWHFYLTA